VTEIISTIDLNPQMEGQVKGVGNPSEKDERLPNLAGISDQNNCRKRNLEVALHCIELH
jgi:hypothetical protein